MSIILLETHQRKLARARKVTIAVAGFCVLLLIASQLYFQKGMSEKKGLKEERDALTVEVKGLLAKEELLKALQSKPMTIGQAMEVIEAATSQRDIPIRIVLAMIDQESEFSPQAVSYRGARGLTQVMPATIKYYIKDPGLQKQIDRPSVNVTGGLMHLAYLNGKFGAWDKSLRAYFAGDDQANNKAFDWYPKSVLRKATKYAYLE